MLAATGADRGICDEGRIAARLNRDMKAICNRPGVPRKAQPVRGLQGGNDETEIAEPVATTLEPLTYPGPAAVDVGSVPRVAKLQLPELNN